MIRLDRDSGQPREPELSTHWLNFFTPWFGTENAIRSLTLHLNARHVQDEYIVRKNTRFVIVNAEKLYREVRCLTPIPTTATCKHTPRFRGDSHSSIFPKPEVSEWPEDVEAYQHALAKLLSDCSEHKVYEAPRL